MAFTSIGKKVTSTTTAALEGQSKPNHITMIGATPTSGSAEKKLPSGSRPRPRNLKRGATIAAHKGLDETPAGDRRRSGKPGRPSAGWRHDHRRHAEAAHHYLPEIENDR